MFLLSQRPPGVFTATPGEAGKGSLRTSWFRRHKVGQVRSATRAAPAYSRRALDC